ncbi:hypothetical protein ACFL1M_02660 [Patescibacteria group bacterium]
MKILLILILLISAPTIRAQQATESSVIEEHSEATPSALNEATPSAEVIDSTRSGEPATNEDSQSEEVAEEENLIDNETIRSSALFVGIATLVLVAFLAGKKSSEYDQIEEE